ncbi:MAG: class I SAM-dependent methyltransferase [Pseudomonadota bacterium]|nr:class I SAM-dependent methyltransferase [Pseudomonadota bacterium]
MIYDCIILFNEIDLLKLRCEELDEVVDRFVVVEAPVTFSGRPKPLYFAKSSSRFDKFRSRIIHVIVQDMPTGRDAWARERHQRNCIRRGITGASGDDGIIISDADEIPSAAAIRRWHPGLGACRFDQLFCYYWINCVGGTWAGSRILPFSGIGNFPDIHQIRHTDFPLLNDGGWHFSYLGGHAAICAKLGAYSHQDLNIPKYRDDTYLSQVTSLGLDLFGRSGSDFDFWDVDLRFPTTVQREPARFRRFICDARFTEKWSSPELLLCLSDLCRSVRRLSGAVIEIGCWEGRSTVVLAHACHPETLLAIDTWRGNLDEHPNHSTVAIVATRDVFQQFLRNIVALTAGNVEPIREDCHAFLQRWQQPVRFAYVDASHDYLSVKRTIEALLPRLVPGGILCGDDILTATCGRADLYGGVERAVRELLPGFATAFNLWWWRQPS